MQRPDLIILDDLENDEQVATPAGRDKLDQWFWKSVLPLGPPDQSHDILVLGTVLHYDSVLCRLLQHPGFEARRFKALLSWPSRMDLWERYERIFWQEGRAEAKAFYHFYQAEMQAGASLLWPEVQCLLTVMDKWCENRASFNSELQNEPLDEAERIFGDFQYYENLPEDLLYFGAIDPSMGGKNRGGDPTAIVILGRSPQGLLYVVEAIIQRMPPDQSIERLLALQRQYRCHKWAVETIQFQEFFKMELLKRAAAEGVPFPAEGIKPSQDKILRIESIQPAVKNGLILFARDQSQLLDQLRYFPKADHDDGPDALHMAYIVAQKSTGAKLRSLSAPAHRWGQYQPLQGFDNY